MIKNIVVAFCALILLSGCGSTKKGMHSGESALDDQFTKEAGNTVYFAFNKSDISAQAKAELCKQAAWLKAHSSVKATVEGNCDTRGTREYNLALGERRAHEAKKVLVKNGIDASRIETISYGKERPAVHGDTEADHALNRRDVTVIRK